MGQEIIVQSEKETIRVGEKNMYNASALYDYHNAGKIYIKPRWDLSGIFLFVRREYLRRSHSSRPVQVER